MRLALALALVVSIACARQSPVLAPDQAQAQATLDRIDRARSAVRWMAAVRVSLQAAEGLEASLYQQGRIPEAVHARIDEWLDLVIEGGIATLTAIEQAGKQAAATGEMRLPAEAVRDLLGRMVSLSERVGQVVDPDAWARLSAILESAVGVLRLILQSLDPAGAVSLGHAAGRVPQAVPAGVPTTTIPLRVYGPMAFGGVR